ncbi:IS110 family transposase [Domibacillus sp. DTU_2020_1001157_1_SI_ALB_TIR_016]|uniref:IS110 family transposase n=1 Tax=Domibacillus sp. DTU_2020_1001157_1_SI_ALB_TIR_016 TaxID=3077789 RepID=UPI0028F0EC9C|nr:IS110 family transposase [Domibacillus sp. DTU_2020_1001157_1_SI_ALB_TIR_016]WNS78705.1 IS110 family transposase [Domibacillus sp. DTU_2020_1001157_1_SI_ALB_TIR_016]WNS79278.1 IS110 family transposase [Domibacillus sp. DTU_2020_1001157_1_SI_ALB_TIR_016]
MDPVVGLDIAKGESQVQAFLEKKKPYKGSFKVAHTLEGLESLHQYLREIEDLTGIRPPVVLESTGHYHTPVVQYFEEKGYLLIIINPLISYRAKSSSLRKVKTDVLDAYHLCELYYKEDLEPHKKRGIQLLNLRNLTRQHANITGIYVQTKLQFQAVLDQVFPEYRGVFGDLYSGVSLLTLLEYPTSEDVLAADEAVLTNKIDELCKSRSKNWANTQAKKLIEAATRNPFQKNLYQSHILSIEMYIKMLIEYQKHLSKLEDEIDALAKEMEEYKIIQSIPGIGEKIAATIISEIGEIDRFNHPKKLVAFAGIDPSIYESGRFKGTVNRITKRGSSRLRHALYMAVRCAIRDCRKKKTTNEIIPRNKKLREFYDKKREEGKPYKVAVIACANKLLQWIYALLKSYSTFQDIA